MCVVFLLGLFGVVRGFGCGISLVLFVFGGKVWFEKVGGGCRKFELLFRGRLLKGWLSVVMVGEMRRLCLWFWLFVFLGLVVVVIVIVDRCLFLSLFLILCYVF